MMPLRDADSLAIKVRSGRDIMERVARSAANLADHRSRRRFDQQNLRFPFDAVEVRNAIDMTYGGGKGMQSAQRLIS